MQLLQEDHRYYTGGLMAAAMAPALLAAMLPIAAWKTRDNRKGVSSYTTMLFITVIFALPMFGVTGIIGNDLDSHYHTWQNPGVVADFIEQLEDNIPLGYTLGLIALLITQILSIRNKAKPSAMRRLWSIAAAYAFFYLALGLIRLALPTFLPKMFHPLHNHEYILTGFGAGLLSLAIGMKWILSAIHHNRRSTASLVCSSCNYDLTGIKDKCPGCGSAISPQTA
ncbi:MAG: hypothetical protein Phyf2KO_22650 [Phycisphaerales bacterium]